MVSLSSQKVTKKLDWGNIGEELPFLAYSPKEDAIYVKHSDWSGSHVNKVTREDVKGFRLSAGSGFAQLGSIGGDWRQMQNLAEIVAEQYSQIPKRKRGLEKVV